jgi:HEPN domain-containing protein
MPPDRLPSDDPREWLSRARSNLSLAKSCPPEAIFEDLCFEAQQSAEKSVKALLLSKGIPFPYIHDLARLLSILEQAGEPIPEPVKKAAELTRYAVITRYPGLAEPVTESHYKEAVEIAETVLAWVEEALR